MTTSFDRGGVVFAFEFIWPELRTATHPLCGEYAGEEHRAQICKGQVELRELT